MAVVVLDMLQVFIRTSGLLSVRHDNDGRAALFLFCRESFRCQNAGGAGCFVSLWDWVSVFVAWNCLIYDLFFLFLQCLWC